MGNKKLLLLILLLSSFTLRAQWNISIDRDCLEHNAAVFSQMLIDLKGDDYVSDLLNKGVYFTLVCRVDSFGHVMNVVRVNNPRKLFSEEFKQDLRSLLKDTLVAFKICYEHTPGKTKEESYDLIRKNIKESKDTTGFIVFGFPGDLMIRYDLVKKEAEEKGKCLTKLDYLKSQIKAYKQE